MPERRRDLRTAAATSTPRAGGAGRDGTWELRRWLDAVSLGAADDTARTRRTRVTMVTEGTYPFVMGGVSTWCHQLLTGLPDIRWTVVAITAGSLDTPLFELPDNAALGGQVRLWGETGLARTPRRRPRLRTPRPDLAAALVRGLLGWDNDPLEVAAELAWCRNHPAAVLRTFRASTTFDRFLTALTDVTEEQHPEIGVTPELDLSTAVDIYHTLYWVARTAAAASPAADVTMVTAAGWSVVPAVVDKALRGTPILLAEHGVYVREAYLAAVRSGEPAPRRWFSTRLARGLSRLTYASADLVCPVTHANTPWELALGVREESLRPIPNGVPSPAEVTPPPGTRTVVSVGRLDPLKDVQTMLRVADAVRRRVPDVTFLHYGPVPKGQEGYAEAARALHAELGLGDTFRFMGATSDPTGVMRDADVVLMTSISEGFPISVLEALSQARPVVTTLVGGVLDAMKGAGLTAPAGDVHGLAAAVTSLLEQPELAHELGVAGHSRVRRLFGLDRCLQSWAEVVEELATPRVPVPVRPSRGRRAHHG